MAKYTTSITKTKYTRLKKIFKGGSVLIFLLDSLISNESIFRIKERKKVVAVVNLDKESFLIFVAIVA